MDRELWLMGPNGEEPYRLVALDENSSFSTISWSPDGQRLAYLRLHQTGDRVDTLIESRNLKGGQPVQVLSDPKLIDLCWLADGRIIYALQEPEPNLYDANLWELRIDVHSGRPISAPKRFTNWAGSWLQGLTSTSDARHLAFSRYSFRGDVYVGELQANGTRLKSLRRLTLSESANDPTGWTADGKAVLFDSDRNGRWSVFKQALDQEWPDALTTGPENYIVPRLSPDGSWVLCLAIAKLEESGRRKLMRVSPSGGCHKSC